MRRRVNRYWLALFCLAIVCAFSMDVAAGRGLTVTMTYPDAARPTSVVPQAARSEYNLFLPCMMKIEATCQSLEPSPFSIAIASLTEFINPVIKPSDAGSGVMLAEPSPILIEALRNSGAGWARVHISWKGIQPTDPTGGVPTYNWAFYDQALALVASAGVQMIGNISETPNWVEVSSLPCPNRIAVAKINATKDFMAAVVNRYKEPPYNIHVWELINEPDSLAQYGCIPVNDPHLGIDYATLAKEVYPVIKAVDPSSTILMGGIAYDWFYAPTDDPNSDGSTTGKFNRYFIDDVVINGGANAFDALNFHYFPMYNSEWERWKTGAQPTCGYYTLRDPTQVSYSVYGMDILAKGSHLINRLKTCYGVEKPLWITEVGANGLRNAQDFQSDATLDYQSRYVFTVYARGLSLGAVNITWYGLKIYHPILPGDYQGLLYDTRDGLALNNQPKPAYYAYQTLSRELQGYRFSATASNSSGAEAYIFSHPCQSDKIIAWSNNSWGYTPFTLKNAGSARLVYRPFSDGSENILTIQDGGAGDMDGTANNSITLDLGYEPAIIQTSP